VPGVVVITYRRISSDLRRDEGWLARGFGTDLLVMTSSRTGRKKGKGMWGGEWRRRREGEGEGEREGEGEGERQRTKTSARIYRRNS
jgi:hypothetical protein